MQQVNLYVEELRPKAVILSLPQLLIMVMVLLLILMALTFWLQKMQHGLESELRVQNSRLERLQALVVEKEQAVSMLRRDDEMAALNERLKDRLQAREKLLQALGTIITTTDYPFSSLLTGLARHPVAGLWLTRMQLQDGGRRIALQGRTGQAEQVPVYLQKLRGETAFLGRTFNGLSVQADERKVMKFELSSEIESAWSVAPDRRLAR